MDDTVRTAKSVIEGNKRMEKALMEINYEGIPHDFYKLCAKNLEELGFSITGEENE